MPSFYIETFGCQMNQRDSETIAALLAEKGYEQISDPSKADVVVLNTCAVRESAENKVWSRLGRIASQRLGQDMPVFVLAGCMAQLPYTLRRARNRAPYVKILTGPGHLHRIPEMVAEAQRRKSKGESVPVMTALSRNRGPRRDETTDVIPEGLPRSYAPGVSGNVTIMYGCDNFCSYCIVPFVRGPQVSREPAAILNEVEDLATAGYQEVVLLGQNVNSYGLDFNEPNDYGFSQLLHDVSRVKGLQRVRYYTSHPKDFTHDMVRAVRDNPKVCEHFHLPLQSGSNRILKLMNRGYTREEYSDLVDYIRSEVPGASITTDIIVGFPGETESDFRSTLDMIEYCGFDGTFSFIFSPRQGTAAAKMDGAIDPKTKSERLQRLVDVQSRVIREYNASLVGTTLEILVEETTNQGEIKGRSRTNKVVTAKCPTDCCPKGKTTVGSLVNVKITEAGIWYLKGEIVL